MVQPIPFQLMVNDRPLTQSDPLIEAVRERMPEGDPAQFQAGVVLAIEGHPHLVVNAWWIPSTRTLRIETTPLFLI
jgi:hypothetical protein